MLTKCGRVVLPAGSGIFLDGGGRRTGTQVPGGAGGVGGGPGGFAQPARRQPQVAFGTGVLTFATFAWSHFLASWWYVHATHCVFDAHCAQQSCGSVAAVSAKWPATVHPELLWTVVAAAHCANGGAGATLDATAVKRKSIEGEDGNSWRDWVVGLEDKTDSTTSRSALYR